MDYRLPLLIIVLMLTACSSVGIESSQVNSMHYGQNIDELNIINEEKYLYRLDYLVDSDVFRFETHLLNDTGEYYAFLFENRKLVGVSRITHSDAYWPKIRKCTLFPANYDLDTNKCFDGFNEVILNNSIVLPNERIGVVNRESLNELQKKSSEDTANTVMGVLYLAPAAVVIIPLAGYQMVTNKIKRKNFEVRLGDKYSDIKEYIAMLPENTKDFRGANGSVYIEGAFSYPIIAFGIYNNRVVWINMGPKVKCIGGMLGFGRNCLIIKNKDNSESN